ncbi:hypothetical protein [Nocardia cyriacigeorgica]|uniref:hypothetical protein n=1 Tax=Nocardia cyriacigeorgica TaxID=135487 RepID=UPI002454826B|nr:hypothetical protein [Nocardia cyriacigeorgica]
MDTMTDRVDFVVLTPAGDLVCGQRARWQSMRAAISAHIPPETMTTIAPEQNPRIRVWFTDQPLPADQANGSADYALTRLGVHHPTGWAGPVAVSMAPRLGLLGWPPLRPSLLDTLRASAERP